MSKMNSNMSIEEYWPPINSIIAINPGTKMTLETSEGTIETPLCVSCSEIYGVVIKHKPGYKWQLDSMEVLIEDRIYTVHRCDPPMVDVDPYFNVREINE